MESYARPDQSVQKIQLQKVQKYKIQFYGKMLSVCAQFHIFSLKVSFSS